ncbi:amidohydrolase family protein [Actinokineospora bangkokensis]|uniref:6-methylsalicylate decarboxylase n=1 Tax=Actinokineospora bangkokensis TaxID=1193682 RepID=A0A1Q9LLK6_9PSEU|nr:amidohydrolase family protein [Actinokineospora bangkokensis]OLR92901.1 amidohydrolase [Actinokineospora bangkokensis]
MTPLNGAIDVHAHYLTPRLRAAMEAAGHSRPDGMPAIPEWTPQLALSTMDGTGVATALLSVSSPGVHFGDDAQARELARAVNDEGAEVVAAHPGRFGLLASLPLPDLDGALTELARACDALGADGITLHTHHAGKRLDHPDHEPLLAELDRRGTAVFLHPTSPPCWEAVSGGLPRPVVEFPFETTRAVTGLVLSGTLQRYPGIRFIVPHAGATLPALADRIAAMSLIAGGPPVDVLGALRGLHYDVAGFPLPRLLPALLTLTENLLYGSDFPFTPDPVVRGLAQLLADTDALTPRQRSAMQRERALGLFPRLG